LEGKFIFNEFVPPKQAKNKSFSSVGKKSHVFETFFVTSLFLDSEFEGKKFRAKTPLLISTLEHD